MENATIEQLANALSDADRAAVAKFVTIQLRAHCSGVCHRELGEMRRDCAAELAAAVEHDRQTQASHPVQARDLIQSNAAELARSVDKATLTRFINTQVENDGARLTAQRLQADRHVEILKVRLSLIDAEVGRAQATSQPLFATRDALRKHLTTAGVLHGEF